jgi:DNA-binding NtrC family response regulator
VSQPLPSQPSLVQKIRVLYVDDDAALREVFGAVFGDQFHVACAASGQEALVLLAERDFDVLVSVLRMRPTVPIPAGTRGPLGGADLLVAAADAHPDLQRIAITDFSDHDDLGEALARAGLFAYVTKPWEDAQLRLLIGRAARHRQLEIDLRRSVKPVIDAEPTSRTFARARLLTVSRPMQNVLSQIDAVAGTDASVLLHGETGTGKELVAAEIHERSPRRKNRFVAQNLAALPPELMTSELFGHVKGAFTGAQQARRGLFELADGGTLFLDEIGEAPMPLQALLLRALEAREFWPVGASEPRQVDVRIVAATNRDLLADARQGLFRLDLYYRLAVCPIAVPPLRARPEDVRGLGMPLLESSARRMNRPAPRITEAAWRALELHPWPGNVRELANVMERLVIYHAGREVQPANLDLPTSLRASLFPFLEEPPKSSADAFDEKTPRSIHLEDARLSSPRLEVDALPPGTLSLDLPEGGTTFDDLEREILAQVLARAEHNQSRAARSLGMSESTFRSRMKRLGLKS